MSCGYGTRTYTTRTCRRPLTLPSSCFHQDLYLTNNCSDADVTYSRQHVCQLQNSAASGEAFICGSRTREDGSVCVCRCTVNLNVSKFSDYN